jgi:hypothetical protein
VQKGRGQKKERGIIKKKNWIKKRILGEKAKRGKKLCNPGDGGGGGGGAQRKRERAKFAVVYKAFSVGE